jgi:hypothetical protein
MKELGSAIASILMITFFWFALDPQGFGGNVGLFLAALGAK